MDIGAVKFAIFTGLQIQRDFPEIGNYYIENKNTSFLDLVKHFGIISRYNFTSEKTAQEAVRYAIFGYDGHLRVCKNAYEGLIPDHMHNEIITNKKSTHGRNSPTSSYRSMTKNDRLAAVKKSHIAQGHKIFLYSEIKAILVYARSKKYYRGHLLKAKDIAQKVNERFYKEMGWYRTDKDISALFTRIKTGKKNLSPSLRAVFLQVMAIQKELTL